MTLKSSTADGSVTLLRRIDAICDRFEAAWQSGQQPRVEDYLTEVEPDARYRLAVELVKLDVARRRDRGETPSAADYADRGFCVTPMTLAELLAADGTPPAAPAGATQPLPAADHDAAAGRAVAPPAGRFRPVHFHAEGGLGEVHVAEDAELPRKVALKRIQSRFAGSAASRARFLREAEITSLLEHPGIVPVYGLVVGPDGEPCYAMRFVEGDSLKDAIDRMHRLPPRSPERERLLRSLLNRFVAVCQAVAFAHSKGVIHRDLKPANVMLGQYGETYVVDWGLAKRIGEADAAASEGGSRVGETQAGHAMGTPAYMAPEQARGDWPAVGPASDIYSLGATLYHLLAGRPPFAGRSKEVIERVVTGVTPEPLRGVPPALAAICGKAMAADAAQRYPSAAEVAAEIERWLSDEPVTAYPEPAGVRLRRWVRRHTRLMTGVAATLAVGLVALGVVAWQSERARAAVAAKELETATERDRAVAARARTREALDAMVSGVTGELLGAQKELSAEQRKFLQSALGYYEEFAAEPGEDRAGRERLAHAHLRLGLIRERLGQLEGAATVFRRAVELYDQLVADYPAVPGYRILLARCHNNLGNALSNLGRPAEAEAAYRAALTVQKPLVAEFPLVLEYRRDLAASLNNLGLLFVNFGRGAEPEVEAAYREALALRETLAAEFPDQLEYHVHLAGSHNNLGMLLRNLRRLTEAEAPFRAALALREKLVAALAGPDNRRDLARSHNNLGTLLTDLGRRGDAEVAYKAALALYVALAADYPLIPDYRNNLAFCHNNLGLLLADLGRRGEAEAAYRAALALYEKLATDAPGVPGFRRYSASVQHNLATLLEGLGRMAEAEVACRAAITLREKLSDDARGAPEAVVDLGGSYCNMGNLLRNGGDAASAVEWHAKAIARLAPVVDTEPRHVTARQFLRNSLWGRALDFTRLSRFNDALPDWERAVELDDGSERDVLRLHRINCLVRIGRSAEAIVATDEIASDNPVSPTLLYNVACAYALASAGPTSDTAITKAITALRRAVTADDRLVPHMLQDPDLTALRRRDDYAALLWDLADTPAK